LLSWQLFFLHQEWRFGTTKLLFYYEIGTISVENVLQTKSWSSGIRNYLEDHDGNIAYILYMGEL